MLRGNRGGSRSSMDGNFSRIHQSQRVTMDSIAQQDRSLNRWKSKTILIIREIAVHFYRDIKIIPKRHPRSFYMEHSVRTRDIKNTRSGNPAGCEKRKSILNCVV